MSVVLTRQWTFRASTGLDSLRFGVEADSEPEATYDAKRRVERWLADTGRNTRDLTDFSLIGVSP